MTKREELYEKLKLISDDDYLTGACDIWLDTDEKVETMLKAYDNNMLKTNDDVLIKILEIEYERDVMKRWKPITLKRYIKYFHH